MRGWLFTVPGTVALFAVMTYWNLHHDEGHPVALYRWTPAVIAVIFIACLLLSAAAWRWIIPAADEMK